MKTRHLTEEAILGLAGKRLTDKAQRAVEEHLAECAECRKQYAEFEFAHSVVGRVAEIGYQEALWDLPREAVMRPKREFAFPWKPILAITFGCVCVIALLFYPRMVPVASAAELLSSAMQYEDRTGDVKAFRIQVSGQTCATGQATERMASFDSSVRCGRAFSISITLSGGMEIANPLLLISDALQGRRLTALATGFEVCAFLAIARSSSPKVRKSP